MKTTTENVVKTRNILTYEPPGHCAELISSELKKGVRPGTKAPKGTLKKIFTEAIVKFLGPKYPAILAKHNITLA